MPKLQVLLPDAPPASHELSEATITIGRVEDNDIQIDDASVSSHHAEFRLHGDSYQLVDLGSTNGTRVNGVPLSGAVALRGGESLRFGHVDAAYDADTGSAPQPMPSEEEHAVLPATSSHRPESFANASPFQRKHKERDKVGTVAMAAAGVGLLAFLVAVLVILTLPAPTI